MCGFFFFYIYIDMYNAFYKIFLHVNIIVLSFFYSFFFLSLYSFYFSLFSHSSFIILSFFFSFFFHFSFSFLFFHFLSFFHSFSLFSFFLSSIFLLLIYLFSLSVCLSVFYFLSLFLTLSLSLSFCLSFSLTRLTPRASLNSSRLISPSSPAIFVNCISIHDSHFNSSSLFLNSISILDFITSNITINGRNHRAADFKKKNPGNLSHSVNKIFWLLIAIISAAHLHRNNSCYLKSSPFVKIASTTIEVYFLECGYEKTVSGNIYGLLFYCLDKTSGFQYIIKTCQIENRKLQMKTKWLQKASSETCQRQNRYRKYEEKLISGIRGFCLIIFFFIQNAIYFLIVITFIRPELI